MKGNKLAAINTNNPVRLIKKAKVLDRTGLSNSGMYEKIKAGDFPQQIRLGDGRAVAWAEHEVDAWIASRIASRNG